MENKPGYHMREIPKGTLGELSKIREELEEAEDAKEQGVEVMVLVELSDMVGAIEAYLDVHHHGTTIEDLHKMSEVTKRAFQNGRRS
jgi:hypothetical protein